MAETTLRRVKQRQSTTVVVVTISLIALVAVFAARGTQRSEPAVVPTSEQKRLATVVDDRTRRQRAHITTCEAIDEAVASSLVFHRGFNLEQLSDGTSQLTSMALLDGQRVDISAILQWDADRQEWELLEAYLGGAPVPLEPRQRDGGI